MTSQSVRAQEVKTGAPAHPSPDGTSVEEKEPALGQVGYL